MCARCPVGQSLTLSPIRNEYAHGRNKFLILYKLQSRLDLQKLQSCRPRRFVMFGIGLLNKLQNARAGVLK
jgi:hypothetical protein|tara:strand:+ start:1147 stop:1359 length:213 start_codon:yes stop_codon:yes gene_type:complete